MVVILVSALFALPPLYWALLMAVLLLVACHEWAGLAAMPRRTGWLFMAGGAVIALKLVWFTSFRTGEGWPRELSLAITGASLAFWLLVAPLWLARGWRIQSKLVLALTGWLVLVSTWFALVQLQSRSAALCLAMMALVWVADSAAYFAGHRFGRRKLAPGISPGKTWEGVYGALAAVALYAVILAACAPWLGYGGGLDALRMLSWVSALMALAALSIVGDLFESWLKRVRGVKDSGTLIPGHGGVLDRIDALTSAMPAAALISVYWLR